MNENARLTLEDDTSGRYNSFWSVRRNKIIIAIIVVCVIAAIVVTSVMVATKSSGDNPPAVKLAEILNTDNILGHLSQLYTISKGFNNSRSVVDGYNASADYVISKLSGLTDFCDISKQYFVVPIYKELAFPTLAQVEPLPLNYVRTVDFIGTRYGGNGTYDIVNRTAVVIANFGCDSGDFAGFVEGDIAVIFDTSICTEYQQALNAELAGASAVMIVNVAGAALANWRVRSVGWTGEQLLQIPVLSVTYTLGNTLRAQQARTTTLSITTRTQVILVETYNVLCLTKHGNENSIMVVGSHLDGVPEGPGINDNGSGTSTVLEIAIQVSQTKMPYENKILFAWWGAEEIGLLGSRHFVNALSTPGNFYNFNNTILNLNFDMLGSPNYIRYVYNAETIQNPDARAKSGNIQKKFEEYFQSKNLVFDMSAMTTGSDYFPFIEAGVAAGALATGAGAFKSEASRSRFGGFANSPLDPCYHLICDTIDNINAVALNDMSKAAAYVVQALSQQTNLANFLVTAQ